MTTLKELAEIAGVSVSTVSKALNDSNDIGDDTKQRIVDLASTYGYNKNTKKRKALLNEGPKIAIIYSDITSNYYSRLIEMFDNHIAEMNGVMVMGSARFATKRIIDLCRYFEACDSVDGIICVSPFNVFGDIPQFSIPMVGLSYPSFETHPYDYICVNDGVGIDEGIAVFKKHGHKKIAFLSEKLTPHRLDFFLDSMERLGLKVDQSLIRVSDLRFEQAGVEMMNDIIEKGNIPTAVFAAYDDIAVGAAKAIYEAGLKIPEDISIAGVDNTMCMLDEHHMLASVNCHMEEQVDIAVSMLMKKVENPDFKVIQNVNLRTSFVERNTIADIPPVIKN